LKPRILFVSYTSEWTGPTNSLLLLVESLRHTYDVSVLAPAGGDLCGVLERRGISAVTLPSITKRYLGRFIRCIQHGRYDLVYANTPDGTSRLAFVAARVAGAKYICHVRALGWDANWRTLGHLRFADAVIAVSRAAADSVARFTPPSRLHVVYNGISLVERDAGDQSPDLRALAGWPAESLVMLGLANICERKGQVHAIAAMDLLRSRLPEARLALVGRLSREPGYVCNLQEMVRSAGLEGCVRFLGFREDGAELLRQADVLVHTALADPHPRAVLEAMAAGIPVVGFDVDGVSETVVHEGTGLLVPASDVAGLAEALEFMGRDPEARVAYGTAGRALVEKRFSTLATGSGVRKVIDCVLGIGRW
jgi:glycosyltransferase involved in cell wall biosynthesis